MKLIAFKIGDYPLTIRPAPATREWMDDTPQAFAYRCLPLNIANSHGWEVLNPMGFSAVWNGETGKEAIQIQYDQPVGASGITHFGSGVLTFHIHALFRTAPDYNLFVMGSPNHLKDGIQALAGVIETDWSPYTFTMNWKFTRPNHIVRFEKDEPICFFFPTPRGLLEQTEPEFQDIQSAPEILAQYDHWRLARDKFNADLYVAGSDAQKQKWQKSYYLGNYPQGDAEFPAHQIKLRLKDFKKQ